MTPELVALLVLHISGLAVWSGALLYLPALIASGASHRDDSTLARGPSALNRMVFTAIATPAALFAIFTGSLLFLLDRNLGLWLIAKLTAVTLMVVCHVLCGLLILRQERKSETPSRTLCIALAAFSLVLIGAALWLVLAKPF